MVHAKRDEIFEIGEHSFAASEVCAPGSFRSRRADWSGPPRQHLKPRFERWVHHLHEGIATDPASDAKAVRYSKVQAKGGFQNAFIFAERGPHLSASIWAQDEDGGQPHP